MTGFLNKMAATVVWMVALYSKLSTPIHSPKYFFQPYLSALADKNFLLQPDYHTPCPHAGSHLICLR